MGLLQQYPYSAVQVLVMLREQGFGGGITTVRDYIQQIRLSAEIAVLTFLNATRVLAER